MGISKFMHKSQLASFKKRDTSILWRRIASFFVFFLLIVGLAFPALAGNPLYMNLNGTPLIWDISDSKEIGYKVDRGGLGILPFEQALVLIKEAMAVWESVSGAGIKFKYLGPTDEEVTIDNWIQIASNHIHAEGYGTTSAATTDSQFNRYFVIVFDNTGEIVAAKGSPGASGVQSHTGVLGTYDDPEFFTSAHIILNGQYYNNNDSDVADLELIDVMAIIVHELGHLLGLDHNTSQYQIYRNIIDGTLDPDYARYMSSMFPRFIKGSGRHMINLHPDEIATLKWMYGAEDYYTISGDVFDAKGQPQYSALVTARNTQSSLCHSYSQATRVTCSDMNTSSTGNGAAYFNAKNCMDDDVEGYYTIPVLTDGGYSIDVSEIPAFLTSAISKFGNNIQELPGDAEFFNEDDQRIESNYDYDEIIMDGDNLDEIDITLSSTVSANGQLDRITYTYFEQDDYFLVLNSDSDCPKQNDFDIESIVFNTAPSSSSNTSTPSSDTSAGCSLIIQSSESRAQSPESLGWLFAFNALALFFFLRRHTKRIS